jgi:alanine racemase
MMGVIKANAYGSLIEVIANKLITLGIEALAVAYVSEGVALRKAGIKVPILVFYPQISNFKKIIKYKLEPAI